MVLWALAFPALAAGNPAKLYMPTTFPEVSVTKVRELLQRTDRIIKAGGEKRFWQDRVRRHRHRSGADDDA